MRKVVTSVSLLMCLSASAAAMDMRVEQPELPSAYVHKIGWEKKNWDKKNSGTSDLYKQLKQLETENEQLRQSLAKIAPASSGSYTNDTRIQALVEENKRLTLLLRDLQKNGQPSKTAPNEVYASKIAALNLENQKLQEQVRNLSSAGSKAPSYALQNEVEQYKQENALLKEALNQRENGGARIVALQQRIEDLYKRNLALEDQNKALRQKDTQQASIVAQAGNYKTLEKDVSTLQQTVQALRSENEQLKQAVSIERQKTANISAKADEVKSAYTTNLDAIRVLQDRLEKARAENAELKQKVASKSGASAKYERNLATLKQQNKSLRDTISAQSESLVSADNASATAERLLSENSVLKRQIEMSEKAKNDNANAAKEIMTRNANLQAQIIQRDAYIKKLEGLKDTVQALRQESDANLAAQKGNEINQAQLEMLLAEKQNLQEELKLERENILTYRTKIKEYQDQISSMAEDSRVAALTEELNGLNTELTEQRLENQELKARIELMSKKNNSVVFQKESNVEDMNAIDSSVLLKQEKAKSDVEFSRVEKGIIATSYQNDQAEIQPNVTYIDAPYPPVTEVKPILGADGAHLSDVKNVPSDKQVIEDMASNPAAGGIIRPEDLLAQELQPLSDK